MNTGNLTRVPILESQGKRWIPLGAYEQVTAELAAQKAGNLVAEKVLGESRVILEKHRETLVEGRDRIVSLTAELAAVKAERDTLKGELELERDYGSNTHDEKFEALVQRDTFRAERDALKVKVGRYEEALKWYATEAMEQVDIYGAGMNSLPQYKFYEDRGRRARQALADKPEVPSE